ncbi:MAG: IS110 family transposase [Acidaminococcaceae bacterium]|nr:IS110 family transposase [Acidaminococcaceae bacterium]
MHVCTETRTADIRRNVRHTADELLALVNYIKGTSEVPTILMEPTSHYHYPLLKAFQDANLPVCLINPYQMKKYGDTALRKAKTDKRDSIRIAQYALEKSYSLIPYTPSDQKYEDLRFLSRQYSQRISILTVNKVQLLALLDQTMPGITSLLPLKSRDPDNCVLLRFVKRFKSFDMIRKMGKTRFLESFQLLVRKTKDRCAGTKGLRIYELALNSVTTRGDNPLMAMTQEQCVALISTSQKAADEINLQMRTIAETLPEYKVLRAMAGVGDRLGPVILAETGDIRRFHSGKALNAYAGNDAPPYQSGQFESRNRHISKRGNPALRKACFEVMQALKLTKPQDDPVYLFLAKKEQEGKPYNVAKMAAVNKFLRIYYARVMELYK